MYESSKIADNIKIVARKQKIQLKDMWTSLGLNKSTTTNMRNGSTLSSDSLARIADYLNCSVDLLLGRTEVIGGENNSVILTDTEADLISIFRDLNDEGQYLVMQTIRSFKTTYKKRDHGSMVAENT